MKPELSKKKDLAERLAELADDLVTPERFAGAVRTPLLALGETAAVVPIEYEVPFEYGE